MIMQNENTKARDIRLNTMLTKKSQLKKRTLSLLKP